MTKAVVLFSGGLDSATTLVLALNDQREVFPFCVDYSQRNRVELEYADRLVRKLQAQHALLHPLVIAKLQMPFASALTADPAAPLNVNVTAAYVPARNAVFLTLAASYAESVGADEVWTGSTYSFVHVEDPIKFAGFSVGSRVVWTDGDDRYPAIVVNPTTLTEAVVLEPHQVVVMFPDEGNVWDVVDGADVALDHSLYPDNRVEFLRAMEAALALGTRTGIRDGGLRLVAPLVDCTKKDVMKTALEIGVDLNDTWSCYDNKSSACGACAPCKDRSLAASKLGMG